MTGGGEGGGEGAGGLSGIICRDTKELLRRIALLGCVIMSGSGPTTGPERLSVDDVRSLFGWRGSVTLPRLALRAGPAARPWSRLSTSSCPRSGDRPFGRGEGGVLGYLSISRPPIRLGWSWYLMYNQYINNSPKPISRMPGITVKRTMRAVGVPADSPPV